MTAQGWQRLEGPGLAAWAAAAAPVAQAVLAAAGPEGWRHGGTWFAGVDALPTDAAGAMPGGPGLPWAELGLAPVPLHPAQLSAVRAGYPQPDPAETEAAARFRRRRDAAHLDGLLPVGPERARMIREPHAWVLGIGLAGGGAGAAPTVVWSGSHVLLRAALAEALAGHPPARWHEVDVTAAYTAARARVFAECPRVTVPLAPGQAVLLHRHLLHGMAPWSGGAGVRSVAWFRPLLPDVATWIAA
ncbi:MAG: hypothetical protein ACK4S2_12495 [Gemmobacter sp.]|uniref:hypothetical protein n=1 Tax=Gemmobacter sp. TaxID=1898957 RepID=UPI00391B6AE4